MARVNFPRGQQKLWINQIMNDSKLKIANLAKICKVSERTIRDWRREKFTIAENSIKNLQQYSRINLPTSVTYLDDYWFLKRWSKIGAQKRMKLYGPPGTPDGRRKGGKISQLKRHLYPELYNHYKFIKTYTKPIISKDLAEMTGIILGDGGITKYQLKITLSLLEEKEYIDFVAKLMENIFEKKPCIYLHKNENVLVITLNGIKLIEILKSIGLEEGSKVRRQANIPSWVYQNEEYIKACLRGLMDTDGCVYYHNHVVNGFKSFNLGMMFSNRCEGMLDFVYRVFAKLGYNPKRKKYGVYIYNELGIKNYFKLIGSHNSHHVERFRKYYELKRRSTQEAYGARLESV